MLKTNKKVLIAGASFAGLSTAYWMVGLGYHVTVVELADSLKNGGTPVDIRDNTVDIVKRMGLFEQIASLSLPPKSTEFKNDDGSTVGGESRWHIQKNEGFEIERDALLALMFEAVRDKVEFIFGDSISTLQEADDRLVVSFKGGAHRQFDLLFGCDGVRSPLRALWFGPEERYSHFLGAYGSVSILPKLLIPENTSHAYSEPGRFVSVSSYNGKTDIILIFCSDEELSYDHRDKRAKKDIMLKQFANMGWRTGEILKEMECADYFYFDKLSQIKMPTWTNGRVALVGDAAYCASPAAGRGGSLAIDGAAALAAAFTNHGADVEAAFAEYNKTFRPWLEEVQAGAEEALKFLVPPTTEALRQRNLL